MSIAHSTTAVESMKSSDSGFTLVELMITVAILGILAAMALPSYRTFVLNQRIKTAAYDLYSSATYARSEAVARGLSIYSIRLAANDTSGEHWESGWKVEVCSDSVCATPTTLKNYQSLSNLGITATSSSGTSLDSIDFMRSGRTSSPGLVTMYITASDTSASGLRPRCVDIGLSGQPFMRDDADKDGSCTNG